MIEIANFITRIIIKNEDINNVKNDVINFRKEFQNIKYTFNPLKTCLFKVSIS